MEIKIDGTIQNVWGAEIMRLAPKRVLRATRHLLGSFSTPTTNASGGSVDRLILATSGSTVRLLTSLWNLTYVTSQFLPPTDVIGVDTRKKLIFTQYGTVPAKIFKNRLSLAESMFVQV